MPKDEPSLPRDDQHIAICGMTGSGKTVASLDMLARRDMESMAWVIFDNKRDEKLAMLPAETLSVTAKFMPSKGLHIVRPHPKGEDQDQVEDLLDNIFNHGKIGVYIDEGHLFGKSPAIRQILVAGRSKRVPMMWCSQRATSIDPFIWSQATFYRAFKLQTPHDKKRFNENFPMKWWEPDPYYSHYFDGTKGKMFYLAPSPSMESTLDRLGASEMQSFKRI